MSKLSDNQELYFFSPEQIPGYHTLLVNPYYLNDIIECLRKYATYKVESLSFSISAVIPIFRLACLFRQFKRFSGKYDLFDVRFGFPNKHSVFKVHVVESSTWAFNIINKSLLFCGKKWIHAQINIAQDQLIEKLPSYVLPASENLFASLV